MTLEIRSLRSWTLLGSALLLLHCSADEAPADLTPQGTGANGGAEVAGKAGESGAAGATSDVAGSGGAGGQASGAGGQTAGSGGQASGAGGQTAGSGGQMAGAGGGGPCVLTDSPPVKASQDGQIIENLRIMATDQPAIIVEGFENVTVRNVAILHEGAVGIRFASAKGLVVEDVTIEALGVPPSGPGKNSAWVNLSIINSPGARVERARLTRGASGVYLQNSPGSVLRWLEGYDFRGPFPRGQLVQWNGSDDGLLEDFSVISTVDSWPEDNVNAYKSKNITVRRGLVDGNNSPSGVGVIFDGDTSEGLVEDVDAVRMGNGCFSAYAGADGSVFHRVRCRENICTDQGRGPPASKGLMFCGRPGLSELLLLEAEYFDACAPNNLVWPSSSFAKIELAEKDFSPRPAIVNTFCWE